MSNKKTVECLSKVLADSYTLYLKTQNYHWNVTGPQFHALHAMFMDQYTELAAAIDEIAERIRALGEKAPGTYSAYAKLTQIKEGNENAAAMEMVKDLLDSHELMLQSIAVTRKAAEEQNDDVTIDMMNVRDEVHQKTAWMLRATSA